MRASALDVLACPACHGELAPGAGGVEGDAGSLRCVSCAAEYPIRGGIAQFIRPDELTGMNRRFAYLYNWFSYVYAAYSRVAMAFIGGEGRNRRDVARRLEPRGGRVLEVSIGPGVNLPYLFALPGVTEVHGLDISPGQLRRCRSLVRRKGWAAELALGTAEALPYKDGAFDAVLHIGGINFFDDRQRAIEEMVRVARPGAKVVIVDEQEKGARFYEGTLPGFKRSFKDERPAVKAPVELVPAAMEEVQLSDIWGGWFYCLEFRKPCT